MGLASTTSAYCFMRLFRGRNFLERTAPNWYDIKETNKYRIDFNYIDLFNVLRLLIAVIVVSREFQNKILLFSLVLRRCKQYCVYIRTFSLARSRKLLSRLSGFRQRPCGRGQHYF
jgi:hypothetical protein